MKETRFMLKKDGCVPYYLSEKEYEEFVEILKRAKTKELEKALIVLSDTFGIDKTVDIVEEELNALCENLLGGNYSFESLFTDTPYGFRSFISKYNSTWNYFNTLRWRNIRLNNKWNYNFIIKENYMSIKDTVVLKKGKWYGGSLLNIYILK